MSLFDRVVYTTPNKPPIILIYGGTGVGKTTLATEFPNPFFIWTEAGMPRDANPVPCVEPEEGRYVCQTYAEFAEQYSAIYNDDHGFETLVIDSLTALNALIAEEACARGDDEGKRYSILDEFPYGKGPVYSLRVWKEVMEWLRAIRDMRNMTVVLLAHSIVQQFKDPETAAYDRYQIALPGSDKPTTDIRGMVQREVDIILLLKRDTTIKAEDKSGVTAKSDKSTVRVRAVGGNVVLANTREKPAFVAKNRHGMPDTIRIEKGKGYEALAPYFPATPVAPVEQMEAA